MKLLDHQQANIYQKRAEENERDEVGNGNIKSALARSSAARIVITIAVAHARQHDLLPALTCRTPV